VADRAKGADHFETDAPQPRNLMERLKGETDQHLMFLPELLYSGCRPNQISRFQNTAKQKPGKPKLSGFSFNATEEIRPVGQVPPGDAIKN
jgi:hypothetical protein